MENGQGVWLSSSNLVIGEKLFVGTEKVQTAFSVTSVQFKKYTLSSLDNIPTSTKKQTISSQDRTTVEKRHMTVTGVQIKVP